MFRLDTWQEVWANLRRNRARAALTAWGVLWGTFMLVLMLGFGSGLRQGVTERMFGFAGNNIYLWARRTNLPYEGMPRGRRIRMRNADAQALALVPGVQQVASYLRVGGYRGADVVTRGAEAGNFTVEGVAANAAAVAPMPLSRGRTINALDVAERRKVAVIGENVRQALFSASEPVVGAYIQARHVYFQVIGVVASPREGDEADEDNNSVQVPLSTAQAAFSLHDRVGYFAVQLARDQDPKAAEVALQKTLLRRHGADPSDLRAIGAGNASQALARVSALFSGIEAFVWMVSLATLAAGALGVSNVMMISVKERTREIGVRKALGATPASVIGLVLQEATLLTSLAGYGGLVLGVVTLEVAGHFLSSGQGALAPPSVDLEIALAACAVLALSGTLAGLLPARAAAKIRPVVALRSD